MKTLAPWFVLSVATVSSAARCQQELPPPEVVAQAAGALDYRVQLPVGFSAAQFRPVVLLLGDATGDAAADRERALALARTFAARGMVVAVPQASQPMPLPGNEAGVAVHRGLAQLPAVLRRRFHVAGGGMHLVALGEAGGAAQQLAQRAPWQFRSVTLAGDRGKFEPAVSLALWDRTCTVFGDAVPLPLPPELQARSPRAKVVHRPLPAAEQLPAALAEHLAALQQAREPDDAAAEVARTLDDFHDAADKGDADRYFAILPPDAVFLGTDGTERWDGGQFQAFALPYFGRGSAWTFVPVVRHVTVGAGGRFAWFDERLDNEAYGECRGSGVLERRDGRWVVRMYDLTIPVPNDIAKALVARVRAFAQGRGDPATTVVVVRHAEKGDGDDPDLTEAGRARAERLAAVLAGVAVTAVFTSEFRRTQETVAPLCRAKGLAAQAVPAANGKALALALREVGPGKVALVAAHSNTVGPLLAELGVPGQVQVADDDFGSLFVVALAPEGARLLRLRY